ncbi:MAG: hypothetical protein LBQ12_00875 [Deltaproteobacteria bacterium]|jgi:hypothetical protein|nr:hypothetical protein [Deltaproteobacteria bacterium]
MWESNQIGAGKLVTAVVASLAITFAFSAAGSADTGMPGLAAQSVYGSGGPDAAGVIFQTAGYRKDRRDRRHYGKRDHRRHRDYRHDRHHYRRDRRDYGRMPKHCRNPHVRSAKCDRYWRGR